MATSQSTNHNFDMLAHNPILSGFHPDPCALQVGDDYYIATSTFEWWPGVEIYHSTDLIHWQWVCNPITRISQANLAGNYNSGSIWAPHLSYAHGKFWLAYTDVKSATQFKDTLNYVISAPSITGPWSEPTFICASGFDPSIFHDDDGRSWFVNMLFDWRKQGKERFIGTVVQELDLHTLQLKGQRVHTFTGTSLGVCEGPQIYKRNGWYYLLCAAGGTEYQHAATISRSRSLFGPWQESPHTPLITTSDVPQYPIQKAGHCSIIEYEGQSYITFLMSRPLTERGNCTLGRETGIAAIDWDDQGWPMLCNNKTYPELTVDLSRGTQRAVNQQRVAERNDTVEALEHTQYQVLRNSEDHSECVLFDARTSLPYTWKTLRMPLQAEQDYSLTARPGFLRLFGGQSLSSLHKQQLFARRWQAFNFDFETQIEADPLNYQQSAGVVLFYDTQHWIYMYISNADEQHDNSGCAGHRILSIMMNEHDHFSYVHDEIVLPDNVAITLLIQVRQSHASFLYNIGDGSGFSIAAHDIAVDWLSDDVISQWRGKTVFTGAMVGICAQDFDNHTFYADFAYVDYRELDC